MTMKKLLMASTALVGAAMLAAPAMAAPPVANDDFAVGIDGTVEFTVMWWDQTANNNDRGYGFASNQSEITFDARATTDTGIEYGFDIEIQTQTDDGTVGDETWMFIDGGDAWGRIELGDADDAGDAQFVDGGNATDGGLGIAGAIGDVLVDGSNAAGSNIHSPALAITSDDTKINYITPRVSGVQIGIAFTPDAGAAGGMDEAANGTDNENIWTVGVNYETTYGDWGIEVAAVVVRGENESAAQEDPNIWGVGTILTYAGWEFGAGLVDLNETDTTTAKANSGEERGKWYNLGLNYSSGDWTIGGGFFSAYGDYADNPSTGDFDSKVYQFGFDYDIAPGWDMAADVQLAELTHYTSAGLDNQGEAFTIRTGMDF